MLKLSAGFVPIVTMKYFCACLKLLIVFYLSHEVTSGSKKNAMK